jgi:hypothetical protein
MLLFFLNPSFFLFHVFLQKWTYYFVDRVGCLFFTEFDAFDEQVSVLKDTIDGRVGRGMDFNNN